MVKTFRLEEFGFEAQFGKFAKQADGAVWLRKGGTVLLATAVSAPNKEFAGFFPLVVDYREQFSAAGKIPGGYYKREGKSSDREVLTSRLIDRAIRPLFPTYYFDQVQILVTVYSVDKENSPDVMALLAASLALVVSKIPLLDPVGVVEVGRTPDGQWIVNPSYPQAVQSDVRLVVAGTHEGICMVEGSLNELPETEVIKALALAHEAIKKMAAWQLEVQKAVGVTKDAAQNAVYSWEQWQQRAESFLGNNKVAGLFVADKQARDEYNQGLEKEFSELYAADIAVSSEAKQVALYVFNAILKEKITERIFAEKKRIDGRQFAEIRAITTEVGLLPCTHGSALFNRGETQALVTVTLGGGQDAQRLENIMSDEEEDSAFMLHYNFPPFCVGEVRPLRAPGRREVGHGYLAASSFRFLLPDKEQFPYTIRVVADMLGSNGSTSMATTCGATMALMDAGVPLKKMVGGIAMGLLQNASGDCIVLSDINGFEDNFGLMDFKVTGTESGVTAIQLDIKYKGGFSLSLFEKALEQARAGRLHIIGIMKNVLPAPRAELSQLVPKVTTLMVDVEKIGAIIGKGGENIRNITNTTKTTIDIEPNGAVKIFGGPAANVPQAILWIKTLAGQIEKDAVYEGKIRRFAEFGIFVELVPGTDGLVHVSNIPKHLQRTFAKELKIDDVVKVRVLEHDATSGRTSLKLLIDGTDTQSSGQRSS